MDENLHKDNLEEFFRKSFEEQKNQPPEEGWDLPSDGIWDGISGGIPVQGTTIPFYQNWKYWAIATAALFTIVSYQFWTYQQGFTQLSEQLEIQNEAFKNLTNELENEREKVAVLEEKIESLNSNNNSEETKETGTQNTGNQIFKSKNNTNKKSINSLSTNPQNTESITANPVQKSTKSNTSNSQKDSNLEKSNSELSTFEKADDKTNLEGENSELKPTPKARIFADNISRIPLSQFSLNIENELGFAIDIQSKIDQWEAFQNLTPPTKSESKWGVSVYASQLFAKRNVLGKMPNFNRPLGEKDLPKSSYNLGMNVNYHLDKKWALFSGFNYQSLDLNADHPIAFKYTEQGAFTDDNGLKTKDYEIDVESSFADLELEMRVSNDVKNDGRDYKEGNPIFAKVESNQHIQNIGLPVGVMRKFAFGKWSFNLKMAAIPTFLISDDLQIKGIRFPDQRLRVKSARFKSNKYRSNLQDVTLDGQLALALHYEIAPNLQLGIEPTFRKNLTPFFENPRVKSEISSFALQAGVTYNF